MLDQTLVLTTQPIRSTCTSAASPRTKIDRPRITASQSSLMRAGSAVLGGEISVRDALDIVVLSPVHAGAPVSIDVGFRRATIRRAMRLTDLGRRILAS